MADSVPVQDLKIASVIEVGFMSEEVRRISRRVPLTVALRRRLAARDVSAFPAFAPPASSEDYARLTALVPKVKKKRNRFCFWLPLVCSITVEEIRPNWNLMLTCRRVVLQLPS